MITYQILVLNIIYFDIILNVIIRFFDVKNFEELQSWHIPNSIQNEHPIATLTQYSNSKYEILKPNSETGLSSHTRKT